MEWEHTPQTGMHVRIQHLQDLRAHHGCVRFSWEGGSMKTLVIEIEYDPKVFDLTPEIISEDLAVLYDFSPVHLIVRGHRCGMPPGICEALNSSDGVYRP